MTNQDEKLCYAVLIGIMPKKNSCNYSAGKINVIINRYLQRHCGNNIDYSIRHLICAKFYHLLRHQKTGRVLVEKRYPHWVPMQIVSWKILI
jgi:hypothetical protein